MKAAVLSRSPQEFVVVELVMCTPLVVPAASVVELKTRLWFGGDPLKNQSGSLPAVSIVQVTSGAAGRGSETAIPVASPPPLLASEIRYLRAELAGRAKSYPQESRRAPDSPQKKACGVARGR